VALIHQAHLPELVTLGVEDRRIPADTSSLGWTIVIIGVPFPGLPAAVLPFSLPKKVPPLHLRSTISDYNWAASCDWMH
jgi:hypothetical protein